jgi:hypothetical protein
LSSIPFLVFLLLFGDFGEGLEDEFGNVEELFFFVSVSEECVVDVFGEDYRVVVVDFSG